MSAGGKAMSADDKAMGEDGKAMSADDKAMNDGKKTMSDDQLFDLVCDYIDGEISQEIWKKNLNSEGSALQNIYNQEVSIRATISQKEPQAMPASLVASLANIAQAKHTATKPPKPTVSSTSTAKKRTLIFPILSACATIAAAVVLMMNIGLILNIEDETVNGHATSDSSEHSYQAQAPEIEVLDEAENAIMLNGEGLASLDDTVTSDHDFADMRIRSAKKSTVKQQLDGTGNKMPRARATSPIQAMSQDAMLGKSVPATIATDTDSTAIPALAAADGVSEADIVSEANGAGSRKNKQRSTISAHGNGIGADLPLKEESNTLAISGDTKTDRGFTAGGLAHARAISNSVPAEKKMESKDMKSKDIESLELESTEIRAALEEARQNVANAPELQEIAKRSKDNRRAASQQALIKDLVENMSAADRANDKEKIQRLEAAWNPNDAPALKLVLAANTTPKHLVLAIQMDNIEHQWFARAILDYQLKAYNHAGAVVWSSAIHTHAINEDITELRSANLPPAEAVSIQLHSLGQKSNILEIKKLKIH